MLGVERNTASSLSVGIAAAVMKSDYDSRDSRDQGKSETEQVYLYGKGRLPGRLHGLYLSGAIGAGKANLEAERAIAFAGRTARSDHDTDIYSASLAFRYPLHMNNWRISPALGVSYVHLREDGFEESGAGSANLEIDARNDDSVKSHLGGRIERPLSFAGLSMTPTLELEWRHEFHPDSEPLKSRLAGGGDKFTTPGRDLAEDMLFLGASLKANISEFAYCDVRYDLEIQDSGGFTGHAVGLQLGVRF